MSDTPYRPTFPPAPKVLPPCIPATIRHEGQRIATMVQVVERDASGRVCIAVYVPVGTPIAAGRTVLVELECVAGCELINAMQGGAR